MSKSETSPKSEIGNRKSEIRLIGRSALSFREVDSTNTLAASYAHDAANDGLVVVADRQTAGRGRHGRSWLSPPGEGLLFSVLLFPPERLRRPAVLTALAAVAVCDAIRDCTQLEASIKWPNDVLVQDKKVCGVLVEHGRGLVIGIGLNVNTPAGVFAEAKLPDAGSLAAFTGRQLDRHEVLRCLLEGLDGYYHDLLHDQVDRLESHWRRYTGLLGKEVGVETRGAVYQGRIMELALNGVVLEEASGRLHHLAPEVIEHIIPLGPSAPSQRPASPP